MLPDFVPVVGRYGVLSHFFAPSECKIGKGRLDLSNVVKLFSEFVQFVFDILKKCFISPVFRNSVAGGAGSLEEFVAQFCKKFFVHFFRSG